MSIETFGKPGEFDESLTELDWAWIAGMIDGEGHVALRWGHRKDSRNGREWTYITPRVAVANTNHDAMVVIAKAFGASLCAQTQPYNRLRIYTIEVCNRRTLIRTLPLVIPHLRIKRRRAELLYEFVQLPRDYGGNSLEKWRLLNEFCDLRDNVERSQRMKEAAGTCDGQDVPRTGMRSASARPRQCDA